MSKVKVTEWVTELVTRSPIELLWTAKKSIYVSQISKCDSIGNGLSKEGFCQKDLVVHEVSYSVLHSSGPCPLHTWLQSFSQHFHLRIYLYKGGVALEDCVRDSTLAKSDLADLGKGLLALNSRSVISARVFPFWFLNLLFLRRCELGDVGEVAALHLRVGYM